MEGANASIAELRLNRLLVAVDGSASADLALSAAVTAARRDNAAITLISVAPDVVAEASRWAWPGQLAADQPAADEFTERILREAIARIPDDIPITHVFRRGKAGPEIVDYARGETFDAILMGTRGRGGVQSLLGSVSRYVMQHAPVPVFVAHAPPSEG